MELSNEFRVSVPVEKAWAVLTDLERIAPCMPGAELKEVEGDEYRGIVKVKVGPITAQYKGAARLVERDDTNHRAVLKAEGRDTRGQGNASATVTADLRAEGDATAVSIVTDLSITGKVAQFGRGVLADVSTKLLGQFVERLEADVLAAGAAPEAAPEAAAPAPEAVQVGTAAGTTSGAQAEQPAPSGNGAAAPAAPSATGAAANGSTSGPRVVQSRPAEPVDLLQTAGGSVAKRVVPVAAVVLAAAFVWWLLRRRR